MEIGETSGHLRLGKDLIPKERSIKKKDYKLDLTVIGGMHGWPFSFAGESGIPGVPLE